MKITKRILSMVVAISLVLGVVTIAGAQSQSLEEQIKTYLSYPQFRGTTQAAGLVDSKTPINSQDIKENWAINFGTGWNSTPGTPIIVGEYLYVVVPGQKKLYRVDAKTGEILKSVNSPGSSQFFSTIGYSDGIIFVPRSSTYEGKSVAILQAYDEKTMEMLWQTNPIGNVGDNLQPLSAVTSYNGYVYVGVSDGPANKGAFACFDTKDENPNQTDERKSATWTYQPEGEQKSGYYWSGAAIVNNAIVFGGESTELVIHSLTDDTVYDTIKLEANASQGIRSTVHYDADTQRAFVSTKNGNIHSIKINGDNTFDQSSLISAKIGNDVTSSPVVFKGRVYIGGGGISSEAGFTVLDANTLDVIYQISDVKTQSSPIITTAYATQENNWQVYAYVIKYEGYVSGSYAPNSSCIYMISDKQGQTQAEYAELITPSALQYCTQSAAIDGDGNMYFYNDSGKMFSFGHKDIENAKHTSLDVENAIKLMQSNKSILATDLFRLNRIDTRYKMLSEQEQQNVSNYSDLTNMIELAQSLNNELDIVKNLNLELATINIQDITINDDAKINSLLASYNRLSQESKKLVVQYNKLIAASQKIQGIKDQDMINSITQLISKLPELNDVCLDDKKEIDDAALKLENQNEAVKAKVDSTKLTALLNKVKEIQDQVNSLNNAIFRDINPMNITESDKPIVENLLLAYQKIADADKKHIINFDDVLFAQKVIQELGQNKTIISDVFENIYGSNQEYTYTGKTEDNKNYQISFNGQDIVDPSISFNTMISFNSKNKDLIKGIDPNAVIISFDHNGKLPGKATVTIDVDLKDGEYSLFYFNELTGKAEFKQKVIVKDSKATFDITHASDYFISQQGANVQTSASPINIALVIICGLVAAGFCAFIKFRRYN